MRRRDGAGTRMAVEEAGLVVMWAVGEAVTGWRGQWRARAAWWQMVVRRWAGGNARVGDGCCEEMARR